MQQIDDKISHTPDAPTIPSPEETMALLQTRRSIRKYQPDPVSEELLEQVLEAGRWAPSASHRQPWAFVVVCDPEVRRRIAEGAAYHFMRWDHVKEAPTLIVLCGDRSSPIYRRFLHEDIGLAGGQMMLQAHALGLGTCWIGGMAPKAIARILNVPNGWEVVGLLTLGFPAQNRRPPRRKPLADIVHYDAFGSYSSDASPKAGRSSGGIVQTLLRQVQSRLRRRRQKR